MSILIIRTDFSPKIGAGHVMRCLALAQEWLKQNRGEVLFISKSRNRIIEARIQREGCRFKWLGRLDNEEDELRQISSILKAFINDQSTNKKDPWIVIDGYHFSSTYQSALKSSGSRILVIDDMAHLNHYHADIILNQNINASRLTYCHESDARLLLGTNYALLRNEFLTTTINSKIFDREVKNVLVSMGGADTTEMTVKVCNAFCLITNVDFRVKILVGPLNPNIRSIKNTIANLDLKIELVSTIEDMPILMNWADIAISSGGSTCWEMPYFGLPALIIVVADNQIRTILQLEKIGALKNMGWYSMVNSGQIASELSILMQNYQLMKKMSDIGRNLVDGKGRQRVLDCMFQKER